MGKVIFLGAGTSHHAGYPLTRNLLNEIESDFKDSPFLHEKSAWNEFDSFRQNASAELSCILNSPNPEIALTVPDLLEATLNEADQKQWQDLLRALRQGKTNEFKEIKEGWDYPFREKLLEGKHAKLAVQKLIDSFFSRKHIEDSVKYAERNYLRRGFGALNEGDTIITTNWDTLAERTLMEIGQWYPTDGYGFSVPIKVESRKGSQFLREGLTTQSPIKVLKLHGSIGWFRREDGQIYLRHAKYLQHFNLPNGGRIYDKNEPPPGQGEDQNPVILTPSYLKLLDDPTLRSIWDQATRVLQDASEIFFVGYSLPSPDVAVRVLINPLRRRVAGNNVQVRVINPGKTDLQTWKEFLGESLDLIKEKVETYWMNP